MQILKNKLSYYNNNKNSKLLHYNTVQKDLRKYMETKPNINFHITSLCIKCKVNQMIMFH